MKAFVLNHLGFTGEKCLNIGQIVQMTVAIVAGAQIIILPTAR
jgi:hypothetical protein